MSILEKIGTIAKVFEIGEEVLVNPVGATVRVGKISGIRILSETTTSEPASCVEKNAYFKVEYKIIWLGGNGHENAPTEQKWYSASSLTQDIRKFAFLQSFIKE